MAVAFVCHSGLNAQSLPINFLFRPNAWAGYEHITATKLREGTISLPSPYASLTVPLKTNIGLQKEPLKLVANQLLYQLYVRRQGVQVSAAKDTLGTILPGTNNSSQSVSVSTGLMGVHAHLNKGIWVYGFRVGYAFSEKSLTKNNYSLLAGAAKLKLVGLSKGYLYGLGFIVSPNVTLPIPVLGGFYKPFREITFYAALPIQVRASYAVSDRVSLALQSTILSRPSVLRSPVNQQTVRFNDLGLKNGLLLTLRPREHIFIFAETGVVLPQQFSFQHSASETFISTKPAIYFDLNFMLSFGKNLIENPLGTF